MPSGVNWDAAGRCTTCTTAWSPSSDVRTCGSSGFRDARIGIVHGKMGQKEIAKVMNEMADGEIDILVCTTIIETGIDIPNANTLIIENADNMGLAQLHQIRGRVAARRATPTPTCATGTARR